MARVRTKNPLSSIQSSPVWATLTEEQRQEILNAASTPTNKVELEAANKLRGFLESMPYEQIPYYMSLILLRVHELETGADYSTNDSLKTFTEEFLTDISSSKLRTIAGQQHIKPKRQVKSKEESDDTTEVKQVQVISDPPF